MRVQDIMLRQPRVVKPTDCLAAAGTLMAEVGCGVLPVVDPDHVVVGILTDRDIALALTARNELASDVDVHEVMTSEVWTCLEGDDIREALSLMRRYKVRRLPVVDPSQRLIGLLSLDDVVLTARALESEGFSGPFYSDIALTLRTICEQPMLAPA